MVPLTFWWIKNNIVITQTPAFCINIIKTNSDEKGLCTLFNTRLKNINGLNKLLIKDDNICFHDLKLLNIDNILYTK